MASEIIILTSLKGKLRHRAQETCPSCIRLRIQTQSSWLQTTRGHAGGNYQGKATSWMRATFSERMKLWALRLTSAGAWILQPGKRRWAYIGDQSQNTHPLVKINKAKTCFFEKNNKMGIYYWDSLRKKRRKYKKATVKNKNDTVTD